MLKEIYARHGIRTDGRICKSEEKWELKVISSERVISLNMHNKDTSDDQESTR